MSIRAVSIWSGLPDFHGRSPAGLQADFHEFATLNRHLKMEQNHGNACRKRTSEKHECTSVNGCLHECRVNEKAIFKQFMKDMTFHVKNF